MSNTTYVPHVGKSLTAGATEGSVVINVKEIKYLSNDGAIDIIFNFENDTAATDAFILKAGEKLTNWNVNVGKLYYVAAGDCAFRLIGTRS